MTPPNNFDRLKEAGLLHADHRFAPEDIERINKLSEDEVKEMLANAENIKAGKGGKAPMAGVVF